VTSVCLGTARSEADQGTMWIAGRTHATWSASCGSTTFRPKTKKCTRTGMYKIRTRTSPGTSTGCGRRGRRPGPALEPLFRQEQSKGPPSPCTTKPWGPPAFRDRRQPRSRP
jgi:hypothetical protein